MFRECLEVVLLRLFCFTDFRGITPRTLPVISTGNGSGCSIWNFFVFCTIFFQECLLPVITHKVPCEKFPAQYRKKYRWNLVCNFAKPIGEISCERCFGIIPEKNKELRRKSGKKLRQTSRKSKTFDKFKENSLEELCWKLWMKFRESDCSKIPGKSPGRSSRRIMDRISRSSKEFRYESG